MRGDLGTDLLRCPPRSLAQPQVVRGLEDLADAILADTLAVELGAEGVEQPFDDLLELDHALDRVRRKLVRGMTVAKEHRLASFSVDVDPQ